MAPTIAVLVNPTGPATLEFTKNIQVAAEGLKLNLHILHATNDIELIEVFASLSEQRSMPLFLQSDPFFNSRQELLVALAARHRLVACYDLRDFVRIGGLISYGASFADAYRQAGMYSGKVLNGRQTR